MAGSGGAILRDLIVIVVLLILPPVACVAGFVTLLASASDDADVSSAGAVAVTDPVGTSDPRAEPEPIAAAGPEPDPEPEPEPADEPEPEPRAEPPLPIKVRLTRRDVADGVKVGSMSLVPCLREAEARGDLKAGRVRLKLDWIIEPDGSVSDAILKGPRRLRGSLTAACVEAAVEGWRFPASRSGVPIKNFAVPAKVEQ